MCDCANIRVNAEQTESKTVVSVEINNRYSIDQNRKIVLVDPRSHESMSDYKRKLSERRAQSDLAKTIKVRPWAAQH